MTDPETLIASHLDGELTEAQQLELNAWIKADPANMAEFAEALMFEQSLHSATKARETRLAAGSFEGPPESKTARAGWSQWRPWTAAAAGLVVGLFSASLVWAYGAHASLPRWLSTKLPLANPGFETMESLPQVPLVPRADQWSGITTEIVESKGALPSALEGRHMMRLGPAPVGKGYFASLVVDLESNRPTSERSLALEISASYHASVAGQNEHYSLYGATFVEAPAEVAGYWNVSRLDLHNQALTSVHRAVFPTADEPGWHRVTVRLEVPVHARSLVISLGSNTPGPPEGRTDHFMDDVRASWVIPQGELQTPAP